LNDKDAIVDLFKSIFSGMMGAETRHEETENSVGNSFKKLIVSIKRSRGL
jgi:hypothetical protein